MPMKFDNLWFVSYGLGEYDPNCFKDIKNRMINKPIGGLWSSPKISDYGWVDFCRSHDFVLPEGFDSGFEFQLNPSSKVYVIDNFYDLIKIPYKILSLDTRIKYIDYEEMAKKYDAIWLTVGGERDTRLPSFHNLYDFDLTSIDLYGWDCETLLILRKECITNIKNIDKQNLPKL